MLNLGNDPILIQELQRSGFLDFAFQTFDEITIEGKGESKESTSAAGGDAYNDVSDVFDWNTYMRTFYKHKDPKMVSDFVMYLFKTNTLQAKKQLGTTSFISQVFRLYPEKISTWMKEFSEKIKDNKTICSLYRAVWMSNTDQGRTFLASVPKTSKFFFKQAQKFLKKEEVKLESFKKGIYDAKYLDLFWSAFFVTGDVFYVNKIIDTVVFASRTPESNAKIAAVEAAIWSLSSNARADKNVYAEILKRCLHKDVKDNQDVKRLLAASKKDEGQSFASAERIARSKIKKLEKKKNT